MERASKRVGDRAQAERERDRARERARERERENGRERAGGMERVRENMCPKSWKYLATSEPPSCW